MPRPAVIVRIGALAVLGTAPALAHGWLVDGWLVDSMGRPWSDLHSTDPLRALSGGLVLVAVLGLAVAWLWLVLCMFVCAADVLRGEEAPEGTAGCHRASLLRPTAVRLLVAAVLGGAISAPSATAAEGPGGPVPSVAGLRLPDRTVGGPVTPAASPVHAPTGAPRAPCLVRRGDTLWGIAAEALPRSARTPPEVDRAWRAVYALNRARIGRDPDVLLPGTALRLPPDLLRSAYQPSTHAAPAAPTQETRP